MVERTETETEMIQQIRPKRCDLTWINIKKSQRNWCVILQISNYVESIACLKSNNFILTASTKPWMAVIQKEKPKLRHWSLSSPVKLPQIWWKELVWPPPPITALQLENQKPAQGKWWGCNITVEQNAFAELKLKGKKKDWRKCTHQVTSYPKPSQFFEHEPVAPK